jgi:protein TonB
MTQHMDILDERDSLRKPFVMSTVFHMAVFGLLILSTLTFTRNREVWGSSSVHPGDAVPVQSVKTIPLPSRVGPINPVANDTESQVPQAPKPEAKKEVKAPPPDAVPIKSRLAEKQPKPQSTQRYYPQPPPPNQVFSSQAPAAISPVFQKPGSGQVGVGQNNILGNRFGAYADRVIQMISSKWDTNGLGGLRTAPVVVVTFDILRDGSVRNVQVAQRSGNSSLDYSAQRAVMDAAPFPPLPAAYERNEANVELQFQLQR